jgi:hypothetical protein
MAVTPASIKARYPEFVSVSDDRVQVFIDEATLQVNPSFFNAATDLATTKLTAHIMSRAITQEEDGGSSDLGNIADMRLGQSQVSFDSALIERSADNEYLSTPYGVEYYALLRRFSGIVGV